MYYYKRNLGDYAKKAGRLSMLQHGAYTLLIDACYDREIFPTREEAIKWTWAGSSAEIEAVEFVLSKFFDLIDGIYVQKRIHEELEKYHENAAINQRIAIERETNRREKSTNRASSVHEPPPNQEPRTINQEPNNKPSAEKPALDNGFEKLWTAYPKKIGKGAAETAFKKAKINGHLSEVLIALESQKKSAQWKKDDGEFIPYPATWINQKRWLDEPEQPRQQSIERNPWDGAT